MESSWLPRALSACLSCWWRCRPIFGFAWRSDSVREWLPTLKLLAIVTFVTRRMPEASRRNFVLNEAKANVSSHKWTPSNCCNQAPIGTVKVATAEASQFVVAIKIAAFTGDVVDVWIADANSSLNAPPISAMYLTYILLRSWAQRPTRWHIESHGTLMEAVQWLIWQWLLGNVLECGRDGVDMIAACFDYYHH